MAAGDAACPTLQSVADCALYAFFRHIPDMAIQPLPAALPHDPLEESAPMALFWSQSLCHNVGVGGESCSAVHGFWQYLRLLQLVASPRHHAKFYRQALLPYIRRGFRRVLVS